MVTTTGTGGTGGAGMSGFTGGGAFGGTGDGVTGDGGTATGFGGWAASATRFTRSTELKLATTPVPRTTVVGVGRITNPSLPNPPLGGAGVVGFLN